MGGPVTLCWERHKPRWACLDQVGKGRSVELLSLQMNTYKCWVRWGQDAVSWGLLPWGKRMLRRMRVPCTSMSSSLFKMVSCLILHPFQTHQVGRVVAVFITMYKHGDWAQYVCGWSRINLLKMVLSPGTCIRTTWGVYFAWPTSDVLNQRNSGARVQKSVFLFWIPGNSFAYEQLSLAYHPQIWNILLSLELLAEFWTHLIPIFFFSNTLFLNWKHREFLRRQGGVVIKSEQMLIGTIWSSWTLVKQS